MKSVSEKGLSLAAEFPPSPIAAVTQIFFLILFFPEYPAHDFWCAGFLLIRRYE